MAGGVDRPGLQATTEHSSATISRHGRTAGHEAPVAAVADAGVDEGSSDVGSEPDAPAPIDDRPALEVLEGRASYYADRFEGRSTASGEPYRASELTAASRTARAS